MKPHISLKQTPSNIKTYALKIHVVPLWFANINMQIVLDSYIIALYCKPYMTKTNKLVTLKLHSIIQKCILQKMNANIKM